MRLRFALAALGAAVVAGATQRFLPSGPLIIGYAADTECDTKVIKAAQTGVNVIIWSFIELVPGANGAPALDLSRAPDLDCVAKTALTLQAQGLATTHMVSIGGWGGPHPLPTNNSAASYAMWKKWNEGTVARNGWAGFDGIDWDMEGVNTLSDPNNAFTVQCLDFTGQFSQLAKADGYRVSMVPPESYWDVSSPLFDLSLRHNYPYADGWNTNFYYHGRSAYAYIFSRYNKAPSGAGYSTPTFDWVAVQLYESFAHALYNTTVGGQSAADYLTAYIPTLSDDHWAVQFGSYPGVHWPTQVVSLNRTQVVIGLANAWTDGSRAILIMPDQVETAYTRLQAKGQAPRGFAFWDIGDEGAVVPGTSGPALYLASGLNAFMHTRP